jgi:ribose transport system substrate-binding protein
MRKTVSALAGAMVAALALTACGGGDAEEPGGGAGAGDGAGGGDQPYIAIVSKGFQHQFWQAVESGAQDAAEELGAEITFEGPESETEVAAQIEMLRTAVDRNPDALAFAALDSQAAAPMMQEAEERGIPVVAFDSGVDSEVPVTTVATDNKAAAALAAEHMVELTGGEGKVAMVVHDQTSVTGVQRRDGFMEYIEENAPGIEIVDVQYGGGDQLRSTDITNAMLQAHPDLAGIYGSNEGSAIGVVNAVRQSGIDPDDLAVIGFDSGQAQIQAIQEGIMDGAITQNPVGMGYQTVEAAIAAINGEELPESIDTGFIWYTAENMDDPEIAAALYE